jgi:hypothetical protein
MPYDRLYRNSLSANPHCRQQPNVAIRSCPPAILPLPEEYQLPVERTHAAAGRVAAARPAQRESWNERDAEEERGGTAAIIPQIVGQVVGPLVCKYIRPMHTQIRPIAGDDKREWRERGAHGSRYKEEDYPVINLDAGIFLGCEQACHASQRDQTCFPATTGTN